MEIVKFFSRLLLIIVVLEINKQVILALHVIFVFIVYCTVSYVLNDYSGPDSDTRIGNY